MSVIRFVSNVPAPNRRRGTTENQKIAMQLKMNPSKWGIVKQVKKESSATSYAASVNQAKSPAFSPKGTFKAAVRKNASGTYTVYVKYLGEHVL
jgi:hypothetical protein